MPSPGCILDEELVELDVHLDACPKGSSLMTKRGLVVSSTIAVFFASGCTDHTTPNMAVTSVGIPPLALSQCSGFVPHIANGFTSAYDCGQTIRFSFGTTQMTAAEKSNMEAAAASWNSIVMDANLNLPHFVFGQSTATWTVAITDNGSAGTGDNWCGQAPSQQSINVTRNGSCSHPGTLFRIALHEVSHLVGFQDTPWHNNDSQNPAVTRHCASVLARGATNATPNTNICQHEIQTFFAAYGIGNSPNIQKHIATGLAGSGSQTIAPANTVLVSVDSLLLDRANGSLCGEDDRDMCFARAGIAGLSFTWASTNANVASVTPLSNGNASVRGESVGAATITATLSANSTYEIAADGASLTFPVTVVDSLNNPTSFTIGSCVDLGFKVNYELVWALDEGSWEIVRNNTNDPTSASFLAAGDAPTESYFHVAVPFFGPNLYWWIRQVGDTTPGPWVANGANGHLIADGCVF